MRSKAIPPPRSLGKPLLSTSEVELHKRRRTGVKSGVKRAVLNRNGGKSLPLRQLPNNI
jgi:hypothetical protein